jgi:translation initiation factor 3 subunit M
MSLPGSTARATALGTEALADGRADAWQVFKEFHGKNEAVFKKLSLEKEACMLKMRLLTLCSLASRQQSIPYGEIASALEVAEEEVEMWAIKAIQANLVDARLDQLQRCLVVNHCSSRLFSQDQWKTMRVKLVGWRDRMKQLKQVIEATRARQQQQMAMMSSQMQVQ